MQKCEQLYEGKAKKVFLTENPDVLIVPPRRSKLQYAEITSTISFLDLSSSMNFWSIILALTKSNFLSVILLDPL